MLWTLLWGALRLVAGVAAGLGLGFLCLGLPWFYWPDDSKEFVNSGDLVVAAAVAFAALCGIGFALRPLAHWWQLWALLGAGGIAGALVGVALGDRLEAGGDLAGLPEGAVLLVVYALAGTLTGFICFLLSVAPNERERAAPVATGGVNLAPLAAEGRPRATGPSPAPPPSPAAAEPVPAPRNQEPSAGPTPPRAAHLPALGDLDVDGRRVLVRCDLNVPMEDGAIADDMRIQSSIPTLDALLDRGARVAVCSHLGRPGGRIVEDLRLAPVGERMSLLLATEIVTLDEIVGDKVRRACDSDAPIVLLENLRFHPGEEANDPEFAAALAGPAGAYVNDAFGSSHRAHASVVGVVGLLPSAAGLLLADEVAKLSRLLESPDRPFVAVLGGAKVSDKLGVITHLLDRADTLVIGGAMAFTILRAKDEEVGRSLVEEDRINEVRDVLTKAKERSVDVLLPTDVVAADDVAAGSAHEIVKLDSIGNRMGVDIGPETSARFSGAIEDAKTILWNGPMGIFEVPAFAAGTKAVAHAVADATTKGAYSVVGGGDSAAALKELGMADGVSHLSTGGGASLEFLEGKDLPGVAALRNQAKEGVRGDQ